MTSRKRREDESFEQYRMNLATEDKVQKIYLRGRVIWDSSRGGTYREDKK